jgi:Leucine-rich repeat (LRR) protein
LLCYPRTDLSSLVLATTAHNELQGSVPSELGSLKNLKFLDVSYNRLGGQIPTEYRTLPVLTNLDLKSNVMFGDLDPVFCNRDELPLVTVLESLEADCLVPELKCSCCTICCINAGADTEQTCVAQNN